jgi:hypothetical protein
MTVNLLAVLLAGVSSMIVGTVWFMPPVFGNRWRARTGVDPNKPTRRVLVYALSFVAALVTAAVLAIASACVQVAIGGAPVVVTLITASVLWLGFTAATTAVHYLFEGRRPGIYVINMGHELATVLVMAVIIGLFG